MKKNEEEDDKEEGDNEEDNNEDKMMKNNTATKKTMKTLKKLASIFFTYRERFYISTSMERAQSSDVLVHH